MQDQNKKIQLLEKKLAREEKARQILEEEIENKSRDLFISYEYTKKLIDSIDNLIIITDENLCITDTNQSWLSDQQDLKGSDFCSLFKLIKGKEKLRDKILKRKVYKDELTLMLNDKTIPVYVKGKVVPINEKQEFVFSLTDLTEMKEIERAQKELQEKIVKNAYADGLAESAISVLHNIGNVLTAMNSKVSEKSNIKELEKTLKLFSVLAQKWETMEKDKINEVFSLINSSFENSLENTTELYNFFSKKCLHISNIITSQQKYANLKETIRIKTDVKEIINDCLHIVGDDALKRSIEIEISENSPPLIMAEKIGLSQVIINVFMNAIESIEEKIKQTGDVNNKIFVEFRDNDGDVLVLIKDTGSGVPKDKLENLFKFGFSTKNRGSGFGLHNCSNYMVNNKGKIEIHSEGPLKGAEVHLSFEKAA